MDGTRYGPWIAEHMMGEGTFAEVWLARHQDRSDQRAALKVLRKEWRTRSSFRARFKDEADTMELLGRGSARIPALAAFFGADCDAETPWIAVEFIDGRPLDRVLADGMMADGTRLSHTLVERAVFIAGIIRHVAAALAFAHRRGIVHRDVKPENILQARDGRVVIIDFGIARDARATRHTGEDMPSPMTPDYAAPEQLDGQVDEHLEPLLDVYALGCTFFELLTGHLSEVSRSGEESRFVRYIPRNQPLSPPGAMPAYIRALVHGMTDPEPTRRPSLGQVMSALDNAEAPDDLVARLPAHGVQLPGMAEAEAAKAKGMTLYPSRTVYGGAPGPDAHDPTWAGTTPYTRHDGTWTGPAGPDSTPPASQGEGASSAVLLLGGVGALSLLIIAAGVGALLLFGRGAVDSGILAASMQGSEEAEPEVPVEAEAPKPFALPPTNLPRHEVAPSWERGRGADGLAGDPRRANAGQLEVETNPPGVLVKLEGTPMGRTPKTLTLSPGEYLVRLEGGGGRDVLKVVRGGRSGRLFVDMIAEQNTTEIVVTSRRTPGPGLLRIDGRAVGAPPTSVSVGPGMHTLVWTPDGGVPVERSVHVRQGEQEYVDL